jgi:tetratricopeptide (TPR) repeat protein
MRARSLRNSLLFEIGKGKEVIEEQKEKLSVLQNDPKEWSLMCEAYIWDNDYESAYSVFEKAIERFPNEWLLYIHGGAALEGLERYDEALECYEKAGNIGTYFYDEYYMKASCYMDLGEYEKAYETYVTLVDKLRADHYDVEAEMAEAEAAAAKAKIK